MQQLYRYYQLEEWIRMPYTYEQFEQEFKQEFFQEHKAEMLQRYSVEERLQGLDQESILSALRSTEQFHFLQTKERAEERLRMICKIQKDLTPEFLLEQIAEDELLGEFSKEELRSVLERLVSENILSKTMMDAVLKGHTA